jgi:hypothetical protein
MKTKTPLPEIEKHNLTIGAFRQRKRLGMDITRMAIKLLFGHGSEDGLDNCRIDVIHDLLEKTGNVFTEMADQVSIRIGVLILLFSFSIYTEIYRGKPYFLTCLLGLV